MSQIRETKKKLKNGHEVSVVTPLVGEGEEVLKTVRVIMEKSEHLLTTPEEFTYTVEQENEMLENYLKHPDKVIIVPKVDGKIVGMMNFSCGSRKRVAHQGEFGMSVHPDFQGIGIGKAMLEALVSWAIENPRIECLRLRVHAKNFKAINLYKSFKFIEEGREIKGMKYGDGDYDDIISMAREVK